MNQAKAVSKYMRISPRKARLAGNLIRNLSVSEAMTQLLFSNLKAGRMLKKTLDSAIANAETQLDARRENLKVIEVRVDEGPTMKRSRSKNRGGSHPVMKRSSHFTIVVGIE